MFRKALARKRRRDREAAGDIKELNITAMMDIMTIILVFLLKSYSSSSVAMMSSQDITPPASTTTTAPRDTVAVTVTPRSILVGDRKIIDLQNGQIPAKLLAGRLVAPLDVVLKREVKKMHQISDATHKEFSGELSVIGDKKVPYDLLLTILYTAGQNELRKYRFVVLQKNSE